MQVYTVTMPGGANDDEFAACVRVLRKWKIDITNIPRVLEEGTPNRWLYAWTDRKEAERFAEDLRKESKKKNWVVHSVQSKHVTEGPLVPVIINVGTQRAGNTYGLDTFSEDLIAKKYPNAQMVPSVFVASNDQQEFSKTQSQSIWDHVASMLTGLQPEELDRLGGYRVYDPVEEKVFKEAECFKQSSNA